MHVLYLDLRSAVDHQHERLGHVRERAGLLLAAAVGSAVLLWPDSSGWNALHYVGLMGFLAVMAAGATIMMPVRFDDIKMQLTNLNDWNSGVWQTQFTDELVQTADHRLATSEEIVRVKNTRLTGLAVCLVLHVSASDAASTF